MGDTVVVCGNQKGGVGKTTTAVHLAVALAHRGLRVLLWDLDTNHGASSHVGLPDDCVGSYEVLALSCPPERAILRGLPGLPDGLDVLPASRALEQLDRALAERGDYYSQPWQCLQAPMASVRASGAYDVVLLDTGPSANTAMRAGYASADAFLAVLRPELPSAEGLETVLGDLVRAAQPGVNPRLRLLGAVLTHVDGRTRRGRQYTERYADLLAARGHAGALLSAQLPAREGFRAAWDARQTLFAHAPEHPALDAVRALAEEFLGRLDRRGPRALRAAS